MKIPTIIVVNAANNVVSVIKMDLFGLLRLL